MPHQQRWLIKNRCAGSSAADAARRRPARPYEGCSQKALAPLATLSTPLTRRRSLPRRRPTAFTTHQRDNAHRANPTCRSAINRQRAKRNQQATVNARSAINRQPSTRETQSTPDRQRAKRNQQTTDNARSAINRQPAAREAQSTDNRQRAKRNQQTTRAPQARAAYPGARNFTSPSASTPLPSRPLRD
ncbi:MAG: hypothetical protein QOC81_4606 [Thermoanaerobaculia bacterium]|jgi:hypothetical protein|nr:hypothetical protein [Thermoanaerobaculia bacterium]